MTTVMDQMRNQIAQKDRITIADAMFLRDAGEEFTDDFPHAYVRRWALATMSEQFVLGKRIDDDAREVMAASMVWSLEDHDPAIRMGALSSVREADLTQRDEVLALAPKLVNDPDQRVRAIAVRMFPVADPKEAPKEGGG
jgi:hypothetical protein